MTAAAAPGMCPRPRSHPRPRSSMHGCTAFCTAWNLSSPLPLLSLLPTPLSGENIYFILANARPWRQAIADSQPSQSRLPADTAVAEQSDSKLSAEPPHAVRFASVNQEIEPAPSAQSQSELPSDPTAANNLGPNAKDELRSLSISLQDTRLQESRLHHFAFEPVSLPASRVCLFSCSFVRFLPPADTCLLGQFSGQYHFQHHIPP
jgi:hypothetical protein